MKTIFGKIFRPAGAAALWLHRRLVPWDPPSGLSAYLWLLWILFFFVPWSGLTIGAREYAATASAFGLFLPLYFRWFWTRARADARARLEQWIIIVLVAALSWALIPFNLRGGGLLIYAGVFAGLSLRPREALPILAILAAGVSGEYLALGIPAAGWIYAPIVTVVLGLGGLLIEHQNRQHRALEASQGEVKRLAAVAERERIARDLHDLLGHTLTLITVKAELAARLAEHDLPGAAREIREVEAISRDALREVREAVGGYRKGGLAVELANARISLTAANIDFDETIEPPELSPEQDVALALALREAVTNIVRHSGARHCRIELANFNGELKLLIEDDGNGGKMREGNGLAGMRERLREVSGRLQIASDPRGTRLAIRLPVPDSPALDAPAVRG